MFFYWLLAAGYRKQASPAAHADSVPPAAIPPAEPKFVTFFFDDYHLTSMGLMFTARAAHGFIAKGLKPGSMVSIVTSSGSGDLDFASDAKLFDEKLGHLHGSSRWCGDLGPPDDCEAAAKVEPTVMNSPEGTAAQSLSTISALDFAAKRLSEMNGTRILVLTSYGFNINQNRLDMERFIDRAVRWNVVVHGIEAHGVPPPPLKKQAVFWVPLEKATEGTGGHSFKATNDFLGAMETAANPEVTYLLAFTPGTREGKFHTLKIRFKSKRQDSVQFRPGYFSPADPAPQLAARAPLDEAVFSNQTLRDIPAAVSVTAAPASVSVAIKVDVNYLQFAADKGRHVQQIVFLMTLLDANGAFVTGKESIMELALTDEKLAVLQKEGLKAVATLSAPAGTYQLRTIIREAMKGNLAASTTPIDLR